MKSEERPIIYVTRDIERALGAEPLGNYFIIAGRTAYAEKIRAQYPDNIMLVDAGTAGIHDTAGAAAKPLDTHEILALPEIKAAISKRSNPAILVFKNYNLCQRIAKESGWQLLNPDPALAERIENKLTQVEWLGDLAQYLPPHNIVKVRDINVAKMPFPFILQWAHSHTGDGTILVSKQADLDTIIRNFPDREARVSQYINGPTLTANVIAAFGTDAAVACPNISYQITGMLPFTENPWSTVGNDWSLPHSILTEAHVEHVKKICAEVAGRMSASGWRGLFGLDFMLDIERDQVYLIEINARQPASTAYESQLQLALRAHGVTGLTIFEAHIASLLSEKSEKSGSMAALIPLNDGAQIVQRVGSGAITLSGTREIFEKLKKRLPAIQAGLVDAGYSSIQYENSSPNSDLLRIQSARGIMEAHNKFNKRGKEILKIVTGASAASANAN